MKNEIILFSVLLILLPLFIICQTWKSTIDLDIEVDSHDNIDLYTNQDGNHILIYYENWPTYSNSEIKYYLFSYDGDQIRSTTIVDEFQGDSRLAKIYGYNGKIYISYRIGSYIYTKRSTNAGQSWSNMQTISLSEIICNGLELWCDNNGLHAVWSETDEEEIEYETYYKRLPHNQNNWTDYKQVTDTSGDFGGSPSITTSANRVHVAYTQNNELFPLGGSADSKTRDKYTTTWQSPQDVSSETIQNHVIADDSKLHMLYYYHDGGLVSHADLYHKSRNLSSSTWSSATLIEDGAGSPYANPVDLSVSNNGNVNIVYYSGASTLDYRSWDGSWSSAYNFAYGDFQKISANCNDIYIIWIDFYDNELKLKQKDFNPLAPQNLEVSAQNNHPYLTWDANNEADLEYYEVWKKKALGSWAVCCTTSNNYFEDTAEDIIVGEPQANMVLVQYKLKAVDYTDNKSSYSDTVQCYVEGEDPDKGVAFNIRNLRTVDLTDTPNEYMVNQNYPNPFNPETNITFGIPEDNFVNLVVYNIQGEKVATLVNEQLAAGSYTSKFDGSALPSGVYIYKIKAGSYKQIKRMLLIK